MKKLFGFLVVLLLCVSVVIGCGTQAPTTPAPTTPAPTAPAPTAPAPTAPVTPAPEIKPQSGGILKAVRGTFPKVLGYPPEMAPTDSIMQLPVAERLLTWDEKGDYVPVLAESWKVDPQNLTITFNLRKGVKFHDGTPFNAEVARWNFQMRLDAGRLTEGRYVKSLEVVDEYTLKVNVTEMHSKLFYQYGWNQMFSQKAIETNGVEWARAHSVGTGPFKLADFQRDVVIRYEKNPDYWRKGLPYLDGMEVRFIPDIVTASAKMEAKEADTWQDTAAILNILDLEKKGLKVNWGPGMFWAIIPDVKDPASVYKDKKVREAVEYALDRPAIAKMIGQGKFEPLHQIAPSAWPGYVPGYDPRPYNPGKAKQLLAEAGFPNGLKTKLMTTSAQSDAAAAIKSYLAAVGIEADLDLADPARYAAYMFSEGWKGLAFAASGINPDATDLYIHFGPSPMTFRTGNILKTPEYVAFCEEASRTYDRAKELELIKKAVRQGGEDCMIIPVYRSTAVQVMQPWVYSDYFIIHGVVWNAENDWMQKR